MPLDPDQPITTRVDDRYGFCETVVPRLVEAATVWPSDAGIVAGLVGRWGVGKTSILNLLDADLGSRPSPHPVFRFSPWFYDDPRVLTLGFFGFLSQGLKRSRQPTLVEAGEAFADLGIASGVISSGVALYDPVSATIPSLVSSMLRGTGALLRRFGKAAAGLNEAGARANEVLEKVAAAGERVVVLVDDVDRLSYDELTTLFRLVRTVADLPAMSLILAVDEERVRKLLDSATGDSFGRDYLDKIIQVKVHVPPPSRHLIRAEVHRRLATLFASLQMAHPSDLQETDIIVSDEMRLLERMLQTPRDVVRFTNSVAVLLLGAGGDQVDAVDAAVLSALDVHYPEGYAVIRSNRPLFAGPEKDALRAFRDRKDDEYRQEYESLLSGVDIARRPVFEAVIDNLFGDVWRIPGKRRMIQVGGQRRRRIADLAHFDTYFSAAAPRLLTEAQTSDLFQHVLGGGKLTAETAEALAALDESGKDQLLTDLQHELEQPLEIDVGPALERMSRLAVWLLPDLGRSLIRGVGAELIRRAPESSDHSWRQFFEILTDALDDVEDYPGLLRRALRSTSQPPEVWRALSREWLQELQGMISDPKRGPADDISVDWFMQARLMAEDLDGDEGRARVARQIGSRVVEEPQLLPLMLESVGLRNRGSRSDSEAVRRVLQHFESRADLDEVVAEWRAGGYGNDPYGLVDELTEMLDAEDD